MCSKGMDIISSDKAFDRVSRKIIDLHLCDSLKNYMDELIKSLIAITQNT